MRKVYMKYIGKGRFLPGIPKRDLTKDEVGVFGEDYLVNTGLYELTKKKPVKIEVEEVIVDDTTEG